MLPTLTPRRVFTSIAPAITFAGVLNVDTEGQLGPVEVILSTFVTGSMFSIFGGQPLCIVGVTGPVTIFTVGVYILADSMDVEFMPFYCWVQIWAALMHFAIAAFNLCDMIDAVSRYSCETFGMLIATIYLYVGSRHPPPNLSTTHPIHPIPSITKFISPPPPPPARYTGIRHLVEYFNDKDIAPALLSLVLGLGTAWLALTLSAARDWSILNKTTRVLIADYGTTFAVILFCAVPYWGDNYDLTPASVGNETAATIATLNVPDEFDTATGRGWLVDPSACEGWAIAFAIVPGAVLTVLFFFDHNVSSLLCQAPEFGLKKGPAYHWDFFMVGLQILVTGLLGIPPVNGLIPQAPLHTDSLCDKETREVNGRKAEVVVGCHENRLSNLGQAVIIGCALFYIKGVGFLPIAALDGLFLYMGIASFGGNSFYNRIVLLITDITRVEARGLDMFYGKVPKSTVHKYTALQFFILLCIFIVTLLPYVSALFPLGIAILVPLRIYKLPEWFGKENVDLLDAEGVAPDAEEAGDEAGIGPQTDLAMVGDNTEL